MLEYTSLEGWSSSCASHLCSFRAVRCWGIGRFVPWLAIVCNVIKSHGSNTIVTAVVTASYFYLLDYMYITSNNTFWIIVAYM